MKYSIILFTIVNFLILQLSAQEASFEVAGAVQIANSTSTSPDPGTIRYNSETKDFEGWNGHFWASLTGKQLGTITDIDGNVYHTIEIGNDIWTIENLKTTRYRDGSSISLVEDNSMWSSNTNGAYCYYNNDATNDNAYGKLYSWYAVATQQLCPTGWKVPFEVDWDELGEAIGGNSGNGGKLKEVGFAYWNAPNIGATNSTGFTARGAGSREPAGDFFGLNEDTYFWALTVTGAGSSDAFIRLLQSDNVEDSFS